MVVIVISLKKKRSRTKSEPRRYSHYTLDGFRRFCSGRAKGKDFFVTSWFYVTCPNCQMKKALEYHSK